MKRFTPLFIVCFAFLSMGCPSKTVRKDSFYAFPEADSPTKQTFAAWLDGAPQEYAYGKTESAATHFVKGEIAYWEGDTRTAFSHWGTVLQRFPESSLTRIAAWRVNDVRSELPNYSERVLELATKIDFEKLPTLSKSSLLFAVQTAALRQWKTSDSMEPFTAGRYGFPAVWKTSPQMSPWRLRDFDRAFAPESEPAIADSYRSPDVATEDPRNIEKSNVYWSSGISLYPKVGSSGIYYLETFAQVDRDTEFWVYGNFASASKLWINGEEVFERLEKDYGSGKRYRRVKMDKGTHRILVKVAYQSGYRDWFDLGFIPTSGKPTDIPIRFAVTCMKDRTIPFCINPPKKLANANVKKDAVKAVDIEPVFVTGDNIKKANDITLYITMLAANLDASPDVFADVWSELEARHEKFAAGHAIESEHITTLWQVPSRLRTANALKALRRAWELAPENRKFSTDLANALGENASTDEIRALLKPNFDSALKRGKVLNLGIASSWPKYMEKKGWDADAENAWKQLLGTGERLCYAGSRYYNLLASREMFVPPSEIGSWSDTCYSLQRDWVLRHPSGHKDRVEWYAREWSRYPLSGGTTAEYANELVKSGLDDAALQVVEEGIRRIPHAQTFWANKVDRAVAKGAKDEARELLAAYEKEHGLSGWVVWKRSQLDGTVPLQDLVADGHKIALDAVKQSNGKSLTTDDAYYVLDFAARRYFPDGSHITLTHTVVRVMTKAAIDRYAEQSLPGNARLLRIRTIKQDGATREPERVAGKGTLSMSGLAEGDFVESAYLQFKPAPSPGSAVDGVKFYFRMEDISTLHSEYVIIGDNANFMMENNAPEKQTFDYNGVPAIRFLAKNNPRPRNERGSVSMEEYLPWIQMYRLPYTVDDFEVSRRYQFERIQDALKTTPILKAQFSAFYGREDKGSEAFIKDAFYSVAQRFAEPSMSSLGDEISHALLLNEGNPSLVLKALFDENDVPAELYVVRSPFARPTPLPVGDFGSYGSVLLRVESKDGNVHWLYPNGPDAMFGALQGSLRGQPAICISCLEPAKETVAESQEPRDRSDTAVKAKLSTSGDLTGTMNVDVHGATAVQIRRGLRARPDETSRAKFIDSLVAATVPGATVKGFKIENEDNPDVSLKFEMNFVRPKYAAPTGGGIYQIEARVFHQSLASAFASLPKRTIPLMLGFRSEDSYRMTVELPFKTIEIGSSSGERAFKSRFGNIVRSVKLEGQTLNLSLDVDLEIQRVQPNDYPDFQKWAVQVEQSSGLLIRMK